MSILFSILMIIFSPLCILAHAVPIKTDYAIFLFDNGEKNLISSMLNYAQKYDKDTLDALDFRIVFLGASCDSMEQSPFVDYKDKLIHYKQLGVQETIERTWKRDQKLNAQDLQTVLAHLHVNKKVLLGVSCAIFEQFAEEFQKDPSLTVQALRDSLSPWGDSDYFTVADQVQKKVHHLALACPFASPDYADEKNISYVGHSPTEEWQYAVHQFDKEKTRTRLGLKKNLPIVVYTGSYGDSYSKSFETFLEYMPMDGIQVVIVPHPRFKGEEEKRLCAKLKKNFPIVGEWEKDPSRNAKTVEMLNLADGVITSDATSTIVFQANALKKKVFYINPHASCMSDAISAKGLIQKIHNRAECALSLKRLPQANDKNVFELLEIPLDSSKLLWKEFLKTMN